MKRQALYLPLLVAALIACGGSNKKESGTPGNSHSDATGDANTDIDTPDESSQPDAGVAAAEPVSPVTFVLKNSAKENLYLNMDKGFAAVIYAYSGQPPNAKSILMFPTHCTASCDSAPEDICPLCEEPTRANDIKAAEKHDEVTPGDSRSVGWDAMVFSYKKTRGTQNGKNARCRCYETVEPPPEEYIIKACGLRKTQSAKKPSKYQCVTSTLTLPVTEPVTVELDFGK
jgi:hypothetical protein